MTSSTDKRSEILALAERCEAATAEQEGQLLVKAGRLVLAGSDRNRFEAEVILNGKRLDAAMTLVPEGWEVALYWGVHGFEPEAQLETEELRLDHPGEPLSGKGKTIALALCAASLRATATRMEEDNHGQ